jgi:twinkle protein
MANISEVSQQLKARAEEIARLLLPQGKREGSEWRCGSVDGDAGGSMAVHLSGDKAGVWSDFSQGTRGADLLDLWAAVKGIGLSEALRQAKAYLGIADGPPVAFVGQRERRQYRKPERPQCSKPASGSAVFDYLTNQRGLSIETLKAYQVAELGREIVLPLKREGELVNVKYLSIDRDEKGKKITRLEGGCILALFGWQAVSDNAREVLICEGELDAMTWYQYGVPSLSVPNGAKSFTWLENEYELLERFETVYLSWDMDADGRAGVSEAIDRLGRYRCRVVELPFKDANECLQNGVTRQRMHEAISAAQSCDPAELKRASSYVEAVIDEFYPAGGIEPGVSSPWPKLNNLLRFRLGEYSVWSGFNGTGKTTLLNNVILSGMSQGERACIASLEIKPKKLLRRMTRQSTAERMPSVELIRDAHLWYDGKLWIFELVGTAKAERLFEVFRYARQRYGITRFVIDSLMRCGIAEDDYNSQKAFADMCAEFATSHEVAVDLVAHSKKRDNTGHEVSRLDVKGSGSITDLAHNVFSVWRNEEKEKAVENAYISGLMPSPDLLDKPDAVLICDKTREGEWTGRAGLWFHKESLQYVDTPTARPLFYIENEEVYA